MEEVGGINSYLKVVYTYESGNFDMRPPPVVTGISPAGGPPGTKVVIRGEHLGVNAKDVTGNRPELIT